jgi:hypothetical protein
LALGQSDLAAQLGEVHLGGLVSYGSGGAYQGGAGLIGGISAGRLVYVGARWVYYTGDSGVETDGFGTFSVEDRVDVFAADVGLQYPFGPVELVGGVTVGALRFSQHTAPITGEGIEPAGAEVATEFLFAPNFSAQIRMLRLLIIPEVMLPLSGSPDLPWPVDYQGPVISVRVVVPIEVDRIRH